MSTVTLELSDELAARIYATPEGLARAAALLAAYFPMEGEEDEELDLSTIPNILVHPSKDALRRAQEDIDAGRGIGGETFLAELRATNEDGAYQVHPA